MALLFFSDHLPYISTLQTISQLSLALDCAISLLKSNHQNTLPHKYRAAIDTDLQAAAAFIDKHPLIKNIQWPAELVHQESEDRKPRPYFMVFQRTDQGWERPAGSFGKQEGKGPEMAVEGVKSVAAYEWLSDMLAAGMVGG